jgi:hypothetical protein
MKSKIHQIREKQLNHWAEQEDDITNNWVKSVTDTQKEGFFYKSIGLRQASTAVLPSKIYNIKDLKVSNILVKVIQRSNMKMLHCCSSTRSRAQQSKGAIGWYMFLLGAAVGEQTYRFACLWVEKRSCVFALLYTQIYACTVAVYIIFLIFSLL